MTRAVLKRGKEKPVLHRHPWIFSGAIQSIDGDAADGDVVTVINHRGGFLATGYLNRHSQIAVRLLSWDEGEAIDRDFWVRRLRCAIDARTRLGIDRVTNAYRLVNAEADLMPGLVVDRYNDFAVVQCLTLGVERWKEVIVDLLINQLQPRGVYERSDVDVREKEGLSPSMGLLHGEKPPEHIEIVEHGHRFLTDVQRGHKTGFYLDQRDNRARLADYACGRTVLNAFAYSGSFGVYAAAAGSGPIVHIDTSAEALELAHENMALNGFADRGDEFVAADVFVQLRRYRDEGRAFDLIVLDPPKFAHSQAQLPSALRGYKDINLLALKLLRPGGVLFTFSCSGLVSPALFQQVVFEASLDADRPVQIIEKLSQAPDHPILLSFPESEYLKGLICQVAD